MAIAAKMVQEDLAIMIEGADGQYYLKAGAIILAGFWRLEDKWGMPLAEIHTHGDVPQFKEKLQKSMERFFIRMTPDKPVCRNNYFIQVDDDLAWSYSIGSEDSTNIGWYTARNDVAAEDMYFRTERQTLRRLPRSGGIVFGIRTYFVPIKQIADEPHVPGRLASGVRSWGDDVAKYKGQAQYKDQLLAYLDAAHAKQVASGLDPNDQNRPYPF